MHKKGKQRTWLFAKYCQVYETNILNFKIANLLPPNSEHINCTGCIFYLLILRFQREALSFKPVPSVYPGLWKCFLYSSGWTKRIRIKVTGTSTWNHFPAQLSKRPAPRKGSQSFWNGTDVLVRYVCKHTHFTVCLWLHKPCEIACWQCWLRADSECHAWITAATSCSTWGLLWESPNWYYPAFKLSLGT